MLPGFSKFHYQPEVFRFLYLGFQPQFAILKYPALPASALYLFLASLFHNKNPGAAFFLNSAPRGPRLIMLRLLPGERIKPGIKKWKSVLKVHSSTIQVLYHAPDTPVKHFFIFHNDTGRTKSAPHHQQPDKPDDAVD